MKTGTKREWKLICLSCGDRYDIWCWNYELNEQKCTKCDEVLEFYTDKCGSAPGIITDDIPGGIEIKHGLIDQITGAPRKFYSKTELKRAANEFGLKISGDTPGTPYKVNWDGVRKRRKDEVYDKMDPQ